MELKYIDIHCHLQDPKFDADRDEVINRMKTEGFGAFVVGTDRKMSEDAVRLAEKHENLWAVVGMHPSDNHAEDFDPQFYRELLKCPRVVAIGECGLDYGRDGHVEDVEKERQEKIFIEHIKLAQESGRPLMIHCRNAYDDLIGLLDEHGRGVAGNIHFFAGDWATAEKFLARGFTLSFDGPITFSHDYDEVIKKMPMDRIMAETDAPYVAPVPMRGKRNEPNFVKYIAQRIGEIKGLAEAETANTLMANIKRTFGI